MGGLLLSREAEDLGGRSMTAAGCWIDNLRPITPAEQAAWKLYLAMHRDHWRAARATFRSVHSGTPATAAVLKFVSETGITDVATLVELERVLRDLAEERGR